ncbi:cytochrome oxidase subunit I (mitochondrion) [Aspergillus oryzae 100-8]|jgi:hypothetical protein|uniref:Uncharacterized protein n=1 Tax=Aspergillus oryzae (strain 3.042) TaxID=1160506 RepID=I6SYB5_ASPO3|nr:hypothetical protein B004_mgp05 [Aspergillus oryzae 3.042]YP_010192313.1 hypothetical protein LKZ27_mgp03 [Aspergillus terricola]KDE74993.1 cytochrome oxidase subunit I [Aspergillus oryzae 100-8]GGB72369.1 hypothetical protein GCM10007199_43170 [Fictibacillus barbaricus]AFM82509.1 hypothetical protein Ao3042_11878 [Aspergillus oryzae 3.042]QZN08050.1 hypothetical protein [Aspergillus terricola]|eukprot:AFM82509.1 hypothetical protein Ao3042_11878 (mitochondrion) [Aspergillus oryzae 3.042]
MFKLTFYKFFNFFKLISKVSIAKPHCFASKPLESNVDILEIVTELARLLPQLADFINQFNNQIITHDINVVTDAQGNLSIQVPDGISKAQAKLISARVNLLDNLIHTHLDKTENLLHLGISVEEDLFDIDPNYETKLTDHVSQFNRLKNSYKH